jgi:hypothetical protein
VNGTLMLLLVAALSLGLSLWPWGKYVLYPFKLFTTWVHECGHAVVAVLVGGSVESVTIQPDTSGLTRSRLPVSRLAQGLVASAGYLGATGVGCLLLFCTRSVRHAHKVVWVLGALMLTTLILWVRNIFGLVMVGTLGALLLFLGRRGRGPWAQFLLSLLSVQVALGALFDIRVLFQLEDGAHSDAATMQSLFLLPSAFWALLWMLVSLGLVALTLWKTRLTPDTGPPGIP